MSTLARTGIPNGTPLSVTLDAVTRVAPDEFLLVYTVTAVVYADVFKVVDPLVAEVLETGFGDGETINAIVQCGGPDNTVQPTVTHAQLVIA